MTRRTWIGAVAAIALGAVAVAAVWFVRGGKPWRPEVVDLPRAEERSDGASLSPDGTLIAWSSDRSGRSRLFIAHADGTGERMLKADASYGEPRWTRDGNHLLSAAGNKLQKLPIDDRPPIELDLVGNSPDDCGAGLVFIRDAFDGDRLIYKPYDGVERELVRSYADERLEKPRCDPGGSKIVFVRGMTPASAFGSDVFIVDLGGKITELTTDHAAGAAAFCSDGTTVIFARREQAEVQLVEVATTGGTPRRLTFSDGADSSPDVSRDGSMLLFGRRVDQFFIYGGVGAGKPRKVSSRRESAYNLRVASPKGEILLAGGAGGVVLVIDTISGTDRVLTEGHVPFPSLAGDTVYFRAIDEPQQLMAIPIAGGLAKKVAKLPGRIVVGTDGPDGQHVMVDEEEHHLVSIRVGPPDREGRVELTDEGAHWVVPAPRGGWRYWQRPGIELELRVIAPGKALGSMDCVFTVESRFNQWLDEHHLAYARTIDVDVDGKTESHDAWYILDVRTCNDDKPSFEVIDVGDHGGRDAVMAPDGVHWFTAKSVSRVTRHVARNFGSRPQVTE